MNSVNIRHRARDYICYEQDQHFCKEIEALLAESGEDELFDRFYTHLTFGTGGLRGLIGGGFNRMNYYVIRRATEGLSRYVLRTQGKRATAVVSYDSRRYSREFAELCASIFAEYGMQVYFSRSLRPTPQLSYTIRSLSASCGVMITASHNPPEYNGYKVYWNDGSQIVSPHDKGISSEIEAITEPARGVDFQDAVQKGTVIYLEDEADKKFVSAAWEQSIRPDLFTQDSIRVAYTPLHGTGTPIMEKLFADSRVELLCVPEQREADGDFPTVKSPNPEEPTAMEMVLEYAKRQKADLVLATDPDSDRLGVAVPENGSYRLLSGNQHGTLLADYVFNSLSDLSRLPAEAVFVNTIVTTDMQQKVLSNLPVNCIQTLTGFKHIADVMRMLDKKGRLSDFIMGTEESYGYLIGTQVWDKDAFTAALLTVEMALHFKKRNCTLIERLEELYRKFGYFLEDTISLRFEGESGMQNMQLLMDKLRNNPASTLASLSVEKILDVAQDVYIIPSENRKEPGPGFPKSNVLRYYFSGGNWLSVRPSGTEPKLKIYIGCTTSSEDPGERIKLKATAASLRSTMETIISQTVEMQ